MGALNNNIITLLDKVLDEPIVLPIIRVFVFVFFSVRSNLAGTYISTITKAKSRTLLPTMFKAFGTGYVSR